MANRGDLPHVVSERGDGSTRWPLSWLWPAMAVVIIACGWAVVFMIRPPTPKPEAAAIPTTAPAAPPAPVTTRAVNLSPRPNPPSLSDGLLLTRPNITTESLVTGPKLTLDIHGGAAEINQQLRSQGLTGVTVPATVSAIELRTTDMPYWTCMESLGRQIGLPGMTGHTGSWTFTKGEAGNAVIFDSPHASSGAFYLEYLPRFSNRKADPAISPTADIVPTFRMLRAPGIELASHCRTMDITLAEDELGHSLLAPVKWRLFISDGIVISSNVEAPIKRPYGGAQRIARLQGTLTIRVPAEVLHVKFENPVRPGATFEAGDYTFTTREPTKTTSGYPKLVLEVRRKSRKPDVLEGGVFELVSYMRPRLVTADDKVVVGSAGGGTQRGFVQVDLSRPSAEPWPEQLWLAADVPVDVREHTLSFSFTDLDLSAPQLLK